MFVISLIAVLASRLIGGLLSGLLLTTAGLRFDTQIVALPLASIFTYPFQGAVVAAVHHQLSGGRGQAQAVASVFA